jgi:hypothetical protein
MNRRWALQVGSLAWAAGGAGFALSSLRGVNGDARLLLAAASVAFPLAALGAAFSLQFGYDRWAGLLLLVSVATPTYFAYILNGPALVAGVALMARPNRVLGTDKVPATVP